MRKSNKRGDVTFVFGVIVITTITFFVLFFFFLDISGSVSSDAQDIACRALIFGKDLGKVPKIGVFFYEMKQKCHVDEIRVNNKDRDSTLKPIAEEMVRCWYRYGNGEKDFLSSWDTTDGDTTGEWCFKCGSIEFRNDDVDDVYEYSDLIDWMKNNEFKTNNGSSISYFDYVNIAVADDLSSSYNPSFEGFQDGLSSSEGQRSEGESGEGTDRELDKEVAELYFEMQISGVEFLNSYRFKKINPEEGKLFVVYRFFRIEKDIFDDIFDFLSAAGTQTGIYGGVKILRHPIKSTLAVKNVATSMGSVKKLGKGAIRLLKKNKLAAVVIGSVSFLYAASNRNYVQFVDVMNEEQYYRQCGTQRYGD